MTPNPFNFPNVYLDGSHDWTPQVDRGFDTTEDELAEFGVLAFEDHVQVEARHLKEDWA